MRVLYFAGWGRSGATIVADILGSARRFGWAGEVQRLWTNAIPGDFFCGCGKPIRTCEFWRDVLEDAVGGVQGIHPDAAIAFDRRFARGRHQLPVLDRLVRRRLHRDPAAREHVARLSRLYGALARRLEAEVVVDSSHSPPYARVLHEVPDIDLRIVHVVRDPRAVAYSWSKWTLDAPSTGGDDDTARWFPRYSCAASSLCWTVWNRSAARLASELPYMLLRYEDFVAEPRRHLREVAAFAGVPDAELPFVDEHAVELRPNHSVWGNPLRYRTGVVRIELDEEWRGRLPARDRHVATALTLPALGRYGYRVRAA